jgi:hypothetical protein
MSKDVIIAKNLVSETTIGAAAHVGHARRVAAIMKGVGSGSIKGYSVKDTDRINEVYDG